MTPDVWMPLLLEACAREGKAAVARRLKVSRTAISLVSRGEYIAKTDRMGARVMLAYAANVACPYLGKPITGQQCRGYALRQCPTASPPEFRHWRACQTCPLKPKEGP